MTQFLWFEMNFKELSAESTTKFSQGKTKMTKSKIVYQWQGFCNEQTLYLTLKYWMSKSV